MLRKLYNKLILSVCICWSHWESADGDLSTYQKGRHTPRASNSENHYSGRLMDQLFRPRLWTIEECAALGGRGVLICLKNRTRSYGSGGFVFAWRSWHSDLSKVSCKVICSRCFRVKKSSWPVCWGTTSLFSFKKHHCQRIEATMEPVLKAPRQQLLDSLRGRTLLIPDLEAPFRHWPQDVSPDVERLHKDVEDRHEMYVRLLTHFPL